jgi:hypothetical protein
MAHAEDGLRPGDVCRHRWIMGTREDDLIRWLCSVCELSWTSVGNPAEVSSYYVQLAGRWLP